jgi:hypothetical protein
VLLLSFFQHSFVPSTYFLSFFLFSHLIFSVFIKASERERSTASGESVRHSGIAAVLLGASMTMASTWKHGVDARLLNCKLGSVS